MNGEDINSDSIKGEINDYFVNKVSQILERIDMYKQQLSENKLYLFKISERLHALYIILSSEINDDEKKIQIKIIKYLRKIKNYVAKVHRVESYGSIDREIRINGEYFLKYKSALEKREIYLNRILKRIGFIATKKTKRIN